MRNRGVLLVLLSAVVGAVIAVPDLWAVAGAPLAQDVGTDLAGPVRTGQHVVIPRLTLDDGSTVSLDLEAFDVFTPATNIVEFTAKGPRRLAPPTDRYFRGSVIGDLDSLVVLASGATLRGFVYTDKKLYAIAPEHDVYGNENTGSLSMIRRLDPERDRPADLKPFTCGADALPLPPSEGMTATAFGAPIWVRPLWTSTVYTVTLAIETDYELFQKFGTTQGELQYIGDLTAAATAIYQRDVKTVFQLGTVHLYSTAADPWSATTTSDALNEVQSYWNANYTSVPRTIVHMLSGKNMGGGIAYLGVLCNSSFGYGVSASLSGHFSTTNPSLYWDILCYTHEIGHNFSSPHTECYTPPVDTCTVCNETTCSGPVPAGGGTIMSYCHLCGGYSKIILYFGLNGQISQAVTDQMRGYVESKAACLQVAGAAPTVSGVAPGTGTISGGTGITVSGGNFQSGCGGEVWGGVGDWRGGGEWDDDHGDDAGARGRGGGRGGDESGPAERDVGRGVHVRERGSGDEREPVGVVLWGDERWGDQDVGADRDGELCGGCAGGVDGDAEQQLHPSVVWERDWGGGVHGVDYERELLGAFDAERERDGERARGEQRTADGGGDVEGVHGWDDGGAVRCDRLAGGWGAGGGGGGGGDGVGAGRH